MGGACSTKIDVCEPTVPKKEQESSPQKVYPIIPPNAKGLRQLATYKKYPEEVKNTLGY